MPRFATTSRIARVVEVDGDGLLEEDGDVARGGGAHLLQVNVVRQEDAGGVRLRLLVELCRARVAGDVPFPASLLARLRSRIGEPDELTPVGESLHRRVVNVGDAAGATSVRSSLLAARTAVSRPWS